MEEVWKDISLSSIHTHRSSSAANHHSLNFQEFLDRPLQTRNNPRRPANHDDIFSGDNALFSPPPPATALSLGTGGGGQFCPPPAKKREVFVGGCDEEERFKRLMKNRESADRSRARKQAYTMELEKEVARLKKENAKLKGQLKMFNSEGYDAQLLKKHILQRTLTSPF